MNAGMAELRAALVESALDRLLSERPVPAHWGMPRCRSCGMQLADHALERCINCAAQREPRRR